jgi:dTDP-4-dehydrorhamnose reductase/UDP-glucose 4-epimerase
VPYLFLSSRKVYAPADRPLAEDAPLGPSDAYGRSKLAIEQALSARLGERLTVLRLANIFGDERIPGRRSFLGLALNSLAERGQIRFDMSPFVERDFLPVETLAGLLARIAANPPGGVLNLGSGIGLPVGRLALWIIEGHGRGELVIERPGEHDPFVLDIARLAARHGRRPCTLADLQARCRALGRALAADRR